MAQALHIQVGTAAVARYRADAALVALLGASTQIRATLDTSGTPAGLSAVIVRSRDLGDYGGHAVLRRCEIRVTVRTHIDEDPDRSTHDAVVSAVMAAAAADWAPTLTGWVLRHLHAATSGDVEADEAGVFRDTDIVQELLAQAVPDTGTPTEPLEPAAPAAEVTEPAGTDRLTIWVGAGLERAYISWTTLAALLGGGSGSGSGTPGDDGADGWSPVLAVASDGERRVLQVVDWTGGSGTAPAVDLYVGEYGLVADIAEAVDVRGAAGADSTVPGDPGADGWSPVLAVASDGERRVLQVVSWTGGDGTPPASGLYLGVAGLVAAIGDAVDIRGAAGADGSGSGAILQEQAAFDGTPYGITDEILVDDSAPQSTEGAAYPELDVTITPTAADSIIECELLLQVAAKATTTSRIVAALFVDSGASAVAAAATFVTQAFYSQLALRYRVTAGSTTARTFHVRVGSAASSTIFYLNRTASVAANLFGGTVRSCLVVREIAA